MLAFEHQRQWPTRKSQPSNNSQPLLTMSVKVLIPTPLQKFTQNQAAIECSGSNIAELIDALEAACPGIKERLCDEKGQPRRFLNFYVNREDIRFLEGTKTAINDGDEVSIVPAVAGG